MASKGRAARPRGPIPMTASGTADGPARSWSKTAMSAGVRRVVAIFAMSAPAAMAARTLARRTDSRGVRRKSWCERTTATPPREASFSTGAIARADCISTSTAAAAGSNGVSSAVRCARESPPTPPSSGWRAVRRTGRGRAATSRSCSTRSGARQSRRSSSQSPPAVRAERAARHPASVWTVATTRGRPRGDIFCFFGMAG